MGRPGTPHPRRGIRPPGGSLTNEEDAATAGFEQGYFELRYGTPFDAWTRYALRREIAGQVAFLAAAVPQPRLLDLGCGLGRTLAQLEPHASHAVGVDVSHFALVQAARDGRQVSQASCVALPFASGAFDGVYMRDVLDMLPADEAKGALTELRRVLRPGGRAVISVMNWTHPIVKATFDEDPHHSTPYTPKGLAWICHEAGLQGSVRTELTITGVPGLGILTRAGLLAPAWTIARLHARLTGRRLHTLFYGHKPAV
ncbi:MAG: class I SAM-dependent methyltransferase [Chloroflexi bacterium]|nr:class I SAM-dependent methyltransferase [Chloroflexota bacterium]